MKLFTHLRPYQNPSIFTLIHRSMTTSKRVRDRSKNKRIQNLEIATEKWKIFSKIHLLLETLTSEPEHVAPITTLDRLRRQINLPRPHKLSDFLRKSPKLFELCRDRKGTTWVGLTQMGEDLLEEEERLIGENEDKAAEYVTRFLMMAVENRVRVDKIAHFRRDLGLPTDFRERWVNKYPELFRVVRSDDDDGLECLELVEWRKEWAVTELEKKVAATGGGDGGGNGRPGMLSLAFPLKYPPNYKKLFRYGGKIAHFQKREYLSPYGDARGLMAGSLEFDKRAVAIMHELLSFTLEKRLVTDHLTHFRQEFVMPQKLMRLLLKHFGIFYVSERGRRYHVFLTEAYDGLELVDKSPLVLWREKVQSLIGYRGKKKKIETFDELSDLEVKDLLDVDSDDESSSEELDESQNIVDELGSDDEEMDLAELDDEYNECGTA
ncbi:hypothetical protein Drorol1_Dr00005134 [Drosera rotundifolia]